MRLAATPLCLAIALALGKAHAAEPDRNEDAVLAELRKLNERVAAQQAEIERLRGQVQELQLADRGRGLSATNEADDQDNAQRLARDASQQATENRAEQEARETEERKRRQGESTVQIGEAGRKEEAERREQEKALVVREHAPLFERKFTLDAGFTYSYYDRRQLALSGFLALDAIFLGSINLDQTKATVGTLEITGRYGLSDRFSLEASVPYVYRDTRFVSGGAGGASSIVSEVQTRSSGIGDASVAAYYQWVKESQRWPDIVTSVRVRAPTGRDPFGLKLIQPDDGNNNLNVPENLPTGSGIWNTTFNISALRTYDPVILFANLGYTYNKPTRFDDISPVLDQISPAKVALGNTLQLSGGLAIALNDRSAVSFSVAAAVSGATHTTAPGEQKQRVPGSSSNSTTLNIGGSYVLPSGWTMNGQLAAGLTPDAPNFVFALRASKAF